MIMTTKTKQTRIAQARALVGRLERWGDQWRFNYWPEGIDKTGIESPATDYHVALHRRAQTLINIANSGSVVQYEGGSWLTYVNK